MKRVFLMQPGLNQDGPVVMDVLTCYQWTIQCIQVRRERKWRKVTSDWYMGNGSTGSTSAVEGALHMYRDVRDDR
jgi:hypothetical protein